MEFIEFIEGGMISPEKSTQKKLKGGIDIHKRGSNICLLNEREEIVKAKRIDTRYEDFSKFFSPLLAEYQIEVALEAGNLAFVVCDYLNALSVQTYVVNPLSNRLIAESWQKFDKRDAKTLAIQLLRRMLPVRVYQPTYSERLLRSSVNHRHKLVADRTRAANKAYALLLRNGIFCSKTNLRKHEQYWAGLLREKIVAEDDLYVEFKYYMEQYQLCNRQIKEIEKKAQKQAESMYPLDYKLLLSISGVGLCIALAVLAYLGSIKRFKNVRKFWGYYGMAPGIRESDGKKVGSSKITKMGPSLLRGYLTQAALSILKNRKKEENKTFIEFYEKIRVRKGWKKARVALAKKLLGVIYGVLKNQTEYIGNYVEIKHSQITRITGKERDDESDMAAQVAEVSPVGVSGVPGVNKPEREPERVETISSSSIRMKELKVDLELDLDLDNDNKRDITDSKCHYERHVHVPHHREIDHAETDQRSTARMMGGIKGIRKREVSIEEIKSVNMIEFLTHHYGMKFSPSGTQYVCLSPFTNEQKPSFSVGYYNGHWLFKDFSSGYGGSLIDFVVLKENSPNVSEALAYLRKLIASGGFEWSAWNNNLLMAVEKGVRVQKGGKGDYNLNYIYRKLCTGTDGTCNGDDNGREVCRKYLLRRCIDEEVVSELFSRGILLHNRYKGHSYCCFAVFDSKGELCCLDNHRIDQVDQVDQVRIAGKGKFVLGKKRIFTLDWESLPSADKIFISEGIIDYLSMKTLEPQLPGLALLGNILNFDEALIRSVRVIVSALDYDAGGVRALLSLKNKFPAKEIILYNLAGCKDPNEYLQTLTLGKKAKKHGRSLSNESRPMTPDAVS